jgi:hypothetical protein
MNEIETMESDDSRALQRMKVNWFFLLVHPIGFAFYVIFSKGLPQSTDLNIFPAGFGVILTFIGVVLVCIFLRNPIKQLPKPPQTNTIANLENSSEESLLKYKKTPKELEDASKMTESDAFYFALGEWRNNCIICLAILQGCALFNILFVFTLGGNVINFACAGVLVAFMILLFPSKYLWESYRNERVPQLLSDGWQSSQSPGRAA